MNPTSIDIKDMLEAESALALTFATDLFVGVEPSTPDNCVTIFDTPGFNRELTFDKTEKYQRPSIQLRVRNRDYETGWELINDIVDRLHGRGAETWNGSQYSVIVCVTEPALLDYDARGNARFFTNFDIQRKPI